MLEVRRAIGKVVRGLLPRGRPRNPTLQEFHFRTALEEIGIEGGAIRVDHLKGQSWHKEVGWVPIVFPHSYIEKARACHTRKTRKYFFRGMITPSRNWINKYDDVSHSERGRQPSVKYIFDQDYFEALNAAEFGISPVGDCPWSYRFFESIMCLSIPLLGRGEVDVFSDSFVVARDGDRHDYDADVARSNYQIFLTRHTLSGLLGSKIASARGKTGDGEKPLDVTKFR